MTMPFGKFKGELRSPLEEAVRDLDKLIDQAKDGPPA